MKVSETNLTFCRAGSDVVKARTDDQNAVINRFKGSVCILTKSMPCSIGMCSLEKCERVKMLTSGSQKNIPHVKENKVVSASHIDAMINRHCGSGKIKK